MAAPPVALVTGGAKRIGRAIVETLAQQGYAVAIHCNRSRRDADGLRESILAQGGRAAVVQGDLADIHTAAPLLSDTAQLLGPVGLLVNNASVFEPDHAGALNNELWQEHFTVNLQSPVWLAQAMAHALPAEMQGCVINLIDQRVLKLTPQFFSYTLTKAALLTATKTMAQAWAPRIRVNAVGPGPTLANVHDSKEDYLQEVAATLLQRAPSPQDIADAVLYLARATAVTGQMIAVDSGQHLIWKTPDIVGAVD